MITGIAIGRLAGFERINDLEEQNQDLSSMFKIQQDTIQELQLKLNERTTELEDGKKRWAYFESRFVECNTCDNEMKEKCIMFSENLCEGERCKTLIDLEALLDKACDKEIKEIE